VKWEKDTGKTVPVDVPVDAGTNEHRFQIQNLFEECLVVFLESIVIRLVDELGDWIDCKFVQCCKDLGRVVVEVLAILEERFQTSRNKRGQEVKERIGMLQPTRR
jgi:hypothetical protein